MDDVARSAQDGDHESSKGGRGDACKALGLLLLDNATGSGKPGREVIEQTRKLLIDARVEYHNAVPESAEATHQHIEAIEETLGTIRDLLKTSTA